MINTEEYRAGAIACLNAIRIINRIEAGNKSETSLDDFWNDRKAAAIAMLQASGAQTEFLTGFITAVAEYISSVEGGGIPAPFLWMPESAMTKEERVAHRAIYEADFADVEGVPR